MLILISSQSTRAFPSQSGTCEITGVPTGAMSGRTVFSGANSRVSFSINPQIITAGQAHQITFSRTSGSGGFRGLLLYAQNESGDRIGIFDTSSPSLQYLDNCGGALNSTITHTDTSAFADSFTINWTAPANYFGNVTFSAIVYESASSTFNVLTPLLVVNSNIIYANGFEN